MNVHSLCFPNMAQTDITVDTVVQATSSRSWCDSYTHCRHRLLHTAQVCVDIRHSVPMLNLLCAMSHTDSALVPAKAAMAQSNSGQCLLRDSHPGKALRGLQALCIVATYSSECCWCRY